MRRNCRYCNNIGGKILGREVSGYVIFKINNFILLFIIFNVYKKIFVLLQGLLYRLILVLIFMVESRNMIYIEKEIYQEIKRKFILNEQNF